MTEAGDHLHLKPAKMTFPQISTLLLALPSALRTCAAPTESAAPLRFCSGGLRRRAGAYEHRAAAVAGPFNDEATCRTSPVPLRTGRSNRYARSAASCRDIKPRHRSDWSSPAIPPSLRKAAIATATTPLIENARQLGCFAMPVGDAAAERGQAIRGLTEQATFTWERVEDTVGLTHK